MWSADNLTRHCFFRPFFFSPQGQLGFGSFSRKGQSDVRAYDRSSNSAAIPLPWYRFLTHGIVAHFARH